MALPEEFDDMYPETGVIADNCDAEGASGFVHGDLNLSILDELLPPEIRSASLRNKIEAAVIAADDEPIIGNVTKAWDPRILDDIVVH